MRILLQNSLFYPHLAGGTERSTYLLARALSARGNEVDILTTTGRRQGEGRNLSQREVEGVQGKVYEASATGLYDDLLNQDDTPAPLPIRALHHVLNIYAHRWRRLTRRVVATRRPEVVHTNNLVGMTVAVWYAAREADVPIVHTIRDLHLLCPRTTMLKPDGRVCARRCWSCRAISHFKLYSSRLVDVVTSPSRFTLKKHRECGGFPHAHDVVVPNACEELPVTLPDRSGRHEVHGLYLGALAAYKGLPELLAALRLLFADPACAKLHFAFAGDGELRSHVTSFCEEQAPRARYLGKVHGPAKTALLYESDFVVIPSVWYETFGRVILDGFSHGLPVIGSNRGGIPEVIRDGHDGQIVLPEPQPLARAMKQYVQDDVLRLEHGRAASVRAREFTLERQVEHFEDIYRDLVHRNG
jgi:glycosyltransferase involved in cell wall biosynthesis